MLDTWWTYYSKLFEVLVEKFLMLHTGWYLYGHPVFVHVFFMNIVMVTWYQIGWKGRSERTTKSWDLVVPWRIIYIYTDCIFQHFNFVYHCYLFAILIHSWSSLFKTTIHSYKNSIPKAPLPMLCILTQHKLWGFGISFPCKLCIYILLFLCSAWWWPWWCTWK